MKNHISFNNQYKASKNGIHRIRFTHNPELTKLFYIVPTNLLTATTNQVKKPKTKLIVTEKKDYPITTNFPSMLETLAATG